MTFVSGFSAAIPAFSVSAADTKAALREVLGNRAGRFAQMVESSRIERRYAVEALPTIMSLHDVAERTACYAKHAVRLGTEAARDVLDRAAVDKGSINSLITLSCTGHMMPSLDAHLIESLDLPRNVRRLPITELGCSAGVASLSWASESVKAGGGSVLIVSAELSSLCLQINEPSPADLLGGILFGDGAAAVIVDTAPHGHAFEILFTQTTLWPGSTDKLGMKLTNSGLRLFLSPALPSLVTRNIRSTVDGFLASVGCSRQDIGFWIIHPGGPRVLEAITDSLELDSQAVGPSWAAWKKYGNLASATVLFIARELFKTAPPSAGELGIMLALGPGISCEMVLVRAAPATAAREHVTIR